MALAAAAKRASKKADFIGSELGEGALEKSSLGFSLRINKQMCASKLSNEQRREMPVLNASYHLLKKN